MSDAPKRRSVPLPATGDIPRVGKVRLGVKVEAKNRSGEDVTRPQATDHFVVTADDGGVTNPESAQSFHDLYPDEPRALTCVLPASTAEDVMEGAWRLYGTGKLKRKCDGVTCDERTATGGWVESPCVCLAQGIPAEVPHASGTMMKNAAHCRLIFTLNVMLPGVQGVGVWQVETQSEISARRVANWLRFMETLVGDLRMVPFELALVPASVAPDGRAKTVYVLEPRATAETQAAIATRHGERIQIERGPTRPTLPAAAADEDGSDYSHPDDGDEERGEETPEESVAAPTNIGQQRLEELKGLPQALADANPGSFYPASLTTIRTAVTAAGIPWKTSQLADDETWGTVRTIVAQVCTKTDQQQEIEVPE